MFQIRLYCGMGGGLFGACVRSTSPFCDSGGERTISCNFLAPLETVAVGVKSCGFLGQAPAVRELPLLEDGEGLTGGTLRDNSFSKLGAYIARFDNISPSIARMNNPSPSLTNVYLDTPLVGPRRIPLSTPPCQDSLCSLMDISRLDHEASCRLAHQNPIPPPPPPPSPWTHPQMYPRTGL